MVTWYWSADTLFWQVPIELIHHRMNGQYQICTLQTKPVWFGISLSIAVMFCDVVVRRTHSRPLPLALLTMKKELHGFLFLCVKMVLLGDPKGRWSSAIIQQGADELTITSKEQGRVVCIISLEWVVGKWKRQKIFPSSYCQVCRWGQRTEKAMVVLFYYFIISFYFLYSLSNVNNFKVIPQYCIDHPYCA